MHKSLKFLISFVLVTLSFPIFQSQASHSIVDGNEAEGILNVTQPKTSAYLTIEYPDGRQRKLKVPLEQRLLDLIEADHKKGTSEDEFKTWPLEATIVNGTLGLRLEDKLVEAEKGYKLWLEYKWREENYSAISQHSKLVSKLIESHLKMCDACSGQGVAICTVSQPVKELAQTFEKKLSEAVSAKNAAYELFSDFNWSSVFDHFNYFGRISMNNLEGHFKDLFKQYSSPLRSQLFDGPFSNYKKQMEDIEFQKKIRQDKIEVAKRPLDTFTTNWIIKTQQLKKEKEEERKKTRTENLKRICIEREPNIDACIELIKYFEELNKTKFEKTPYILINQVALLVEKYGGTYETDEWIIAGVSMETSRCCPHVVQTVQNIKKAALTLKGRADKYSHGLVLHSTFDTQNLIDGEDYSLEFLCSDMIETIKVNLKLYNRFNSPEHPQTEWKVDIKIKELDL